MRYDLYSAHIVYMQGASTWLKANRKDSNICCHRGAKCFECKVIISPFDVEDKTTTVRTVLLIIHNVCNRLHGI